jgi:hypothetical protein
MHGPDIFRPCVARQLLTGNTTVYHVGMGSPCPRSDRRWGSALRCHGRARPCPTWVATALTAILLLPTLHAQVIEFESAGLKYKTLTRNGVTVMFAPLPNHIHDFTILQVSISNGSPIAWAIRPEDFWFERSDGARIQASTADAVVHLLAVKGSRDDVKKLMTAYEAALYGMPQIHSTNGYESRRLNAMADGGSVKIKAAAAASAIVLSSVKLKPGQSSDGAVFYATQGKALGSGKLVVNTAGETFEFPVEESHAVKP